MFYTINIACSITTLFCVFYPVTHFLLYTVNNFCAVQITIVINRCYVTRRNLISHTLTHNSYTFILHLHNNHLSKIILFHTDLYYTSPNKTHSYIYKSLFTFTIHPVSIYIYLTLCRVLRYITNIKRAIVRHYICSTLFFRITINFVSTILTISLRYLLHAMTFILFKFQLNE